MARGVVTTARGERLDMEHLIMNSRKRKNVEGDMKDTVPARKSPARQLNMRGFVPSAAGVPSQVVTRPIETEQPGPSVADFTGVRIDAPRRLKSKPDNSAVAANDALREIMTDLEQFDTKRSKKTT